MIALTKARADGQIVLLGDHKQLPPVVLSQNDKMKLTLFDKFIKRLENLKPSSSVHQNLEQKNNFGPQVLNICEKKVRFSQKI